ncbi:MULTISPECIES: AzlC family ABC transporter permease [unclassified Rhizobium]|uniref:AzlC family ABC transporter permease n=1 Tax=unclassified Rhizobium TaxID=2613769 RepID=UPI0010486B9C|nr:MULTISPECIES: AzlC family ABC transporter permease [unclassified Rhizobium]MBB3398248.1 4-azaleucine resistance transporter AzlC [Rhizobium sp. BK060]MBB4168552.1 4-azaleucine resistance transporter AzlC [Rhizobium sp. BK538]TCM73616.1 4-azaleucine resistance transporter AzlC [Rhizobium sp. BK068]
MLTQRRSIGDFLAGARAILPLIVAVIPIGLVFGAVSATKGLSPLEATLMSALVFAGGSQFVAMDIWTHPASWAGVGFAALLVNIRHVLMSASLGTKMQAFSGLRKYAAMLFLADEIWAIAEFRAGVARLTPSWFAGIAMPFYVAWVGSTLIGASLGAFLGDPAAIGLDFAFPAVFVVLAMGFWKGRETGSVLAASALAAVLVHQVVPGVWYIAAGALAGLAAALLTGKAKAVTA